MNTGRRDSRTRGSWFATRSAVLPMALFLVAAVVMCSFSLVSFSRQTEVKTGELSLMTEFDTGINNISSDALSGIIKLKKEYVIPENVLVCPEPNKAAYNVTTSAGDVEQAIGNAQLAGFVEAGTTLWNRDIETWKGTPYEYYQDDTILVVMWKEYINQCIYNFAEIYIAHPSQFRRMITDNEFGSVTRTTPSALAESVNAVCAMSADFYAYRGKGIVVYDRTVYRNNAYTLDTMFVDENGDFIFTKPNTAGSDQQLQQFVDENKILFSLSFGPILIQDGELRRSTADYDVGQTEKSYARAAIGQMGKLHYLYCTVDGGVKKDDKTDDKEPGTTVLAVGKVFAEKGCANAYTLDGGQTATIIMDDHIFNRVGYGNERQVSDIIYFATAKAQTKE